MRGAKVRELIQQIAVRPDLIRYVSVRVHRKENVGNVIGQRPAILRKGYRAARIIGENVWQQRFRDAFRILRRVATRVFQFVCEYADEAIIICWVPAEVFRSLFAGKENRLQGPSTAVCLDPAVHSLVHCASPNSYRIGSQSRVGEFNHDAANIFVCEEVIPCELHVIEIAVYVEKERIAAPTKEKAVAPGFRHQGFPRDFGGAGTIPVHRAKMLRWRGVKKMEHAFVNCRIAGIWWIYACGNSEHGRSQQSE